MTTKLIKKNKYEQIKESLISCDFDISIDYCNTCVNTTKKHGGYLFEFVLYYDKEVENLVSSDYLNPEEGDIKITYTDIQEFAVYDHKLNIIELEDIEIQELSDIVYEKLVGIEIIS